MRTGKFLYYGGLILVLLLQACGNVEVTPAPAVAYTPNLSSTPTATTIPATSTPNIQNTSPVIPTPTLIPSPTPDKKAASASWKSYQKPQAGFTILLPPDWKTFEPTRDQLKAGTEAIKTQNPAWAAIVENFVNISGIINLKFFGTTDSNAATPMFIDVATADYPTDNTSLDALKGANFGNLLGGMFNTTNVTTKKHDDFPNGGALEWSYDISLKANDQSTTLSITQYLFAQNDQVYFITLGTASDQPDEYKPIFDKIGRNFRVVAIPTVAAPIGNSTEPVIISNVVTIAAKPGYVFYKNTKTNTGLELPDTWQLVDLNPATITTTLNRIKSQNPKLGALLSTQAHLLSSNGGEFYAYNPPLYGTVNTFNLTSMNVVKTPASSNLSLKKLIETQISTYAKLGVDTKTLIEKQVQLAAGEAEEIQFQSPPAYTGTSNSSVVATQYFLIHGANLYIISFSTQKDQNEKYAPIFDRITQSFQFN